MDTSFPQKIIVLKPKTSACLNYKPYYVEVVEVWSDFRTLYKIYFNGLRKAEKFYRRCINLINTGRSNTVYEELNSVQLFRIVPKSFE